MKQIFSFLLILLCLSFAQAQDAKPPVVYAADPLLTAEMFTLKVGESFAVFKTPDICGARTVITLNVESVNNGVTRLRVSNVVCYYADGKTTYDSPKGLVWTLKETQGNVCLNEIPLVLAQDEL